MQQLRAITRMNLLTTNHEVVMWNLRPQMSQQMTIFSSDFDACKNKGKLLPCYTLENSAHQKKTEIKASATIRSMTTIDTAAATALLSDDSTKKIRNKLPNSKNTLYDTSVYQYHVQIKIFF